MRCRWIAARFGQLEIDDLPQERIGDLNQDACAVTAARLGALSTAVFKVEQRGDRLVDDVAAAPTVHVDDHGHAARIMFERGVIQPDALGRHSHLPLHQTFCAAFISGSDWAAPPEVAGLTPSALSTGCPPG